MRTYAVIDSSQRVGFHHRLQDRGIPYRSLFDGHAEQTHPEIAPLLLPWAVNLHGSRSGRAHADILKLAVERPAVIFIESTSSLDELAVHFHRFHLVKLPNRREMLLRWYDTRILPVWFELMTAAQRSAFSCGIAHWRYYDRYGQEVSLPSVEAPDGLPTLPPVTLDNAQYAALQEACGVDVLLAHLRDAIPDELRQLPQRVLYPFLSEHLEGAKRHGLESLDDQAQYAMLALYTCGECLKHPHVQSRLAAPAAACAESFSAWAMAVPDDVFSTGKPLWMQA